ncbi:IS110 family transposase [Glutamicibacter protophormiae]
MQPFLPARDFLTTIPGVSALVADVLIAETGSDMDRFEDAGHLRSWAGITPGHHQPAGKVLSAHT